MKSIILSLSIFTLFLFASCGKQEPILQFVFFNTGDAKIKYYLIQEKKDTVISMEDVAPKSKVFYPAPKDIYTIGCKNDIDKDEYTFFKEKLDTITTKDNYYYECIDVTGKSNFALVDASYLYNASNSFAEALKNPGGKAKQIITDVFVGDKPFRIWGKAVFPYDPLPKKTNAMSSVWVLVPYNRSITEMKDLLPFVDSYLKKLPTEN
jgi:hypothetical protein